MKHGCIDTVLFDFDGTLTLPGSLDFARIREEIGCPADVSILDFIERIPDPQARQTAEEILSRFELNAAAESVQHPAGGKILEYLKRSGIRTGIITRNTRACVERALLNCRELSRADFGIIITRDDPHRVKPEPDGILHAARTLETVPARVLVVGDYLYDIEAGKRAGALTVFLDNLPKRPFPLPDADYRIGDLSELLSIVRLHRPLHRGKLPNDLLELFLSELRPEQTGGESLLDRPGIGEDTAAAVFPESELILLKSDPITFVGEKAGRYAVTINANDIATAGGTPRWFLATLLFPPGTVPAEIRTVLADIGNACAKHGIELAGGHTEISDAVKKPLISGTLAGSVPRDRLVRKSGMRQGDIVYLTKSLAIEGTGILADSFAGRLSAGGMSAEEIERCSRLTEKIGIVAEAETAVRLGAATAMHDVTEGGFATAVRELSAAGAHRLRIELDRVPVLPETRKACAILGLNPLGLIGSGSLLICCRKDLAGALERELERAGIAVSAIGEVGEAGKGVEAFSGGKSAELPEFASDELARLSAGG